MGILSGVRFHPSTMVVRDCGIRDFLINASLHGQKVERLAYHLDSK